MSDSSDSTLDFSGGDDDDDDEEGDEIKFMDDEGEPDQNGAGAVGAGSPSDIDGGGACPPLHPPPTHAAAVWSYKEGGGFTAKATSRSGLDVADKTVGVILGGMCGDILGAPAEGQHMTAHQIEERWGPAGCRDFEAASQLGLYGIQPLGQYTDDTNSVLALATSLVQAHGLDPQDVAESYARFWAAHEPERGYPE